MTKATDIISLVEESKHSATWNQINTLKLQMSALHKRIEATKDQSQKDTLKTKYDGMKTKLDNLHTEAKRLKAYQKKPAS